MKKITHYAKYEEMTPKWCFLLTYTLRSL